MIPRNRFCWSILLSLGLAYALVASPSLPARDLGDAPFEGLSINSWTVEDGLPGNAVVALAKDGDGYLWVATPNGPARFDGARVIPVRLWDGLPSLLTQRLLADRKGRLWIGTQDAGLVLLEAGRFRSLTQADGLPGQNVRGLAEDPQGGVWVATDGGLVRWDGKLTNVALAREGPAGGFNSVCSGGQKVFAVSDDWKVWEWKDDSWNVLPPLRKKGFRFDQIFVSRTGVLWSQLNPTGLARLEGETWRYFGSECGLPETYISCALERTNGEILFGSFERGLYRFQNNRATPVLLNKPPDMDGVLALSEDAEGNLWAGTRTRGLLRLRQPRVRTLPGGGVVRIARMAFDKSGRFWLGGGEGLWFGKAGELSPAPLPERLQKWNVATMLPASDGGVWIGVYNGGLWRFDPDAGGKALPRLPPPNLNASVTTLAADQTGGIWCGTISGRIIHWKRDGVKWFSPEEAAQKRISALAVDSGGVWAGTEGAGLLRLNETGKVELHLGREQGLPGRAVRSLLLDRNGVVWIGTVGGLCRWDNSHLQVYDSRHGLPDEHIASLAEDGAGRLWVSANNCLFRLDKAELEAIAAGQARVAHPMIVGPSDGLKPVPFATGISSECIGGPDGRLYFPRIWDVLTFSPQDFEKLPVAPKPRIEEVLVDGEPVSLRAIDASPVRVPPQRSQIEIRYTAFQWMAPEALRFRYRLAGVDKDWTESGDQRVATFRRLPPGNYRFEATATVGGGEWAVPASLAFVIEPVFWQTAWFRGLTIVLGIAIIGSLVWRRVRALEQRRAAQELFSRRLLESQEAERRRIAAELHDGLGQALLVIKNTAVIAADPEAVPNEMRTDLATITRLSTVALEEVRTITHALRPPELDRLGLTKALEHVVQLTAGSGGLKCSVQLESLDGCLSLPAEIQLYRVVQESLNNVVKHARATYVEVRVWRADGFLRAHVQDNGEGFDSDRKSDKPKTNGGLGLAAMAERMRLLGGEIVIRSQPGSGTVVEARLPIEMNSINKSS